MSSPLLLRLIRSLFGACAELVQYITGPKSAKFLIKGKPLTPQQVDKLYLESVAGGEALLHVKILGGQGKKFDSVSLVFLRTLTGCIG